MLERAGLGKILILEDDRTLCYQLEEILVSEGYDVLLSSSYEEGKEYVGRFPVEVILIDVQISGKDGLSFVEELRTSRPFLPVIVLSSDTSLQTIKKAIKLSIFDFITKPPNPDELSQSIHEAITKYRQSLLDQAILKNSRQHFEELMTLMEVSKITNSFENINLLLNRVIELVSQILDVESVSLMTLDEGAQELTMAAYLGSEREVVKKARVPLGTGISGWVALQGKPLLINNIEKSEEFKKFRKTNPIQYKNESLLCVPLKIKERVIGVLNVNNKRSGETFNLHDLDLLKSFSNHIALVIENARLYEKLQAKARELENANKELTQLDQMKSNFLSNISHEVRTPLTSINGYAELLMEMRESLSPEEQKTFLQAIQESGKHLSTIFDHMVEFSLVESGGMKLDIKPVEFDPLIKEVILKFRCKLEEKQITLVYQPSQEALRVYADEEKISRVLYHFVDNAIKFNKENGKIFIKIELIYQKSNITMDFTNFIKVSIKDTGKGISKENITRMFKKFNQLGNILTDKPPGVGLGLALCKEIIHGHHGEVGVESEPEKGSTFYFTLPLVTEKKA